VLADNPALQQVVNGEAPQFAPPQAQSKSGRLREKLSRLMEVFAAKFKRRRQ